MTDKYIIGKCIAVLLFSLTSFWCGFDLVAMNNRSQRIQGRITIAIAVVGDMIMLIYTLLSVIGYL